MTNRAQLTPDDPAWPARFTGVATRVTALGDVGILRGRVLALLCSVACPGDVILALGDLALALRAGGVTVASGFQSPLERECLHYLLRGTQLIIHCPARGMASGRVAGEWRAPLAAGRLLVLSPFAAEERRVTAKLAAARNRFVARLSDAVCLAHAAPGGQMAALAAEIAGWGKPLLTLPSPANAPLVALGARALAPAEMVSYLASIAPPER